MRQHSRDTSIFGVSKVGILGSLVALAIGGTILSLDIADVGGRGMKYVGVLSVTPFLAAAFATPLLVAGVGIITFTAAYEYGVYRDVGDSNSQLIRLLAIALATIVAMLVAFVRSRHERRISQLQRVAEVAQQALLRPVPISTSGIRSSVLYRSAAAEARIGGDLYEVLDTPFGVRALIGDVRGKGLDAVRLASVVLGAFRYVAFERSDLAEVARDLDHAVQRAAGSEDFVTCVLAHVDASGEAVLVNCGHPAPLLLDGETATECVPTVASPPLGLGVSPNPQSVWLGETSQLLLYTDGLVEARNSAGEFFPLVAVASNSLNPTAPDQGLSALEQAVINHTEGRLNDDVAMLVITREHSTSNADYTIREQLSV